MSDERTCNKCGWVHFAVTRAYAEQCVSDFNEYIETLTPEKHQEAYGGRRADLTLYDSCFSCGGNYKDFHATKPHECPEGSTLQPIIHDQN